MMMMMTVLAFKHNKATTYKKTSEVKITRSKSLVTFVLDLKPCKQQLDTVRSELLQLDRSRVLVVKSYMRWLILQVILFSQAGDFNK